MRMAVMPAGMTNYSQRGVWGLNSGEVRTELGSVGWGSYQDGSLEEEEGLGGMGVQCRTRGARGVSDIPRGEAGAGLRGEERGALSHTD